jgi:hypothetical protein
VGSAVPPREISALIPITRATGRSGPALQASLDTPEDRADQAARMGASELSLYNFGLVRPRDISAFAADTRRNSQGRTPPAQQ